MRHSRLETGIPANPAITTHRPNWHEEAPKVLGACLHVRLCTRAHARNVYVRARVFNSEKIQHFLFIQTAVPSDFNPLNSCSNSFRRPWEETEGEQRGGGEGHLTKYV